MKIGRKSALATKAASAVTPIRKVVVHPERQKLSEAKARRLAELYRYIKG